MEVRLMGIEGKDSQESLSTEEFFQNVGLGNL
jgi:hypothetical protein